jgi:polysaccharide biosynthesis/export protein
MRKFRPGLLNSLAAVTIALMFASCHEGKLVPYFKNIPDSAKLTIVPNAVYTDPIIMPDDILAYAVVTIDPTTSAPVNQAAISVNSTSSSSTGASSAVSGLLVDKDGNISIPILGTIKVAGLTTFEAKAIIKQRAEKYFKGADVQLRFANFSVTVMGEVNHPGSFTVPSEKISVVDALGLAGDLTIYGRRENILVIREVDGKKAMARLDLNSSDIFKSPYFYLRQNDVIYVEPNKDKAVAADAERTRILTVAAAVATVLIVLFSRINFK